MEIAKKLQQFLEMADVEVILTRDSDAGLYDENASNLFERKPHSTITIGEDVFFNK